MVKYYSEYLKENNEYSDVKKKLREMVKDTAEKTGSDFEVFVSSYNKYPEKYEIEGLINDSDVYDFYLKFSNDIDEVLNNMKFFTEPPSKSNSYGLYDYTINGTKKAIEFLMESIIDKLS